VLSYLGLFALIAIVQAAGPSSEMAAPTPESPQLVKQAVPAPAAPGPAPAFLKGAPPAGKDGNSSPEGEFTDAITLPTDRQVKKRLEVAQEDYIKSEAWTQACSLLQSILDSKEDVFVQVRRKGANNQEQVRWVSARAEANRLLGTMPAKGLDFYELQYGGQAKKLLTEAKKTSDPQLLATVAQRFYHTEAGAEATDLLGTYHLDRGRALMAALCYDHLLRREGADQLPPLTLYKAALAFRLAGDASGAASATDASKRLAARLGRDGLRIGDETVALADLQKELERAVPGEVTSPYVWAMFMGNPSRSAKGRGSAPFLEGKWQKSLVAEPLNPEARHWIEDARRRPHFRPAPMLPALYPIAVAGKLIYRSYVGIHAVDIKTGKLEWDSVALLAGLNALAGDLDMKRQVHEWYQTYLQVGSQNILFENSTIGTLSCDNNRVYAVDDMAIPPYPGSMMTQVWGGGFPQGQGSMNQKLSDLSQRSRLLALDLETGKIAWERGDPNWDKSELAGSYFLGPPLPLGGKLYILTEKNGELRLVCLESAKGEVNWAQTLATAREKLSMDVSRRVQAVHLSYAEGILVCPTNAGAILGVDLLSRSLVWAFPYREKTPVAGNGNPVAVFGRPRFPGGMGMPQEWSANLQKLSEDWKMSAPIIEDGKVIFTAPDGNAIHCLNLQDGNSIWQAERRDDIYLAGVFQGKVLLVGKNMCRALSLADGKHQLWQVETGMPSGQGVASGPHYYLPLKKGAVAVIDMEKGIVTTSPAPKDATPGNLLFYEGDVISQTETSVTAFEQVDAKVAQINMLLKKNPQDPDALAERGELKLYKGDLPGAVADLRDAATNNPQATTLAKVRAKLYATLTELLQRDFNSAQQYLEEYKGLCKMAIPPNATPEEKQRLEEEQRRRQAGYLSLLAKGREEQGRLLDAFQAYLEFAGLAESSELVSVINEPSVKARPDVWAQGRIAALVAKATPEQRRPLDAEIARRWQEVQASKDPKALPHFVAEFGSLFAEGREARLQLADRLINQGTFIEAELQLLQLRRLSDEPKVAARAVEALARLMTRKGLLEDAAYYYRILNKEFGQVIIRNGKTGAELYRDLGSDKRFLPYLDEVVSPFTGTIRAMELPSERRFDRLPAATFEGSGEDLPFYERTRLAWTPLQQPSVCYQFQLIDQDSNQELWSIIGASTRVPYLYAGGGTSSRFPFYSAGHFVVLYLGHTICALDLVDHKKLWERELLPPDRFLVEQPGMQYLLTLDSDGGLQLSNPQGGTEKLGQIGSVTASCVCLRVPEGLVALDPVRGTVLWTKTDVSPYTRVFGDDRYVYLVEVRDGNNIGAGRVLRVQDGATVDAPNFSAEYQRRQRIIGGRLLISESAPTNGLVLRLYDILSGKDLWKRSLPAKSLVLRPDRSELCAMVEPDGNLTVVNLLTLQEVFHAAVLPAHLEKAVEGLLLQDDKHYYAILNNASDQNNGVRGPYSNLLAMRCAVTNGTVYSFDRDSGKLGWYVAVPHQMILLEPFRQLPMLIFSAKYSRPVNAAGNITPVSATLTIDKRTGKRLYDSEVSSSNSAPPMQGQFYRLAIDRQAGTIDLISSGMILRHAMSDAGGRQNLKGALGAGPKDEASAATPRSP